jgi:hypothetical protein
MTYQTEFGQLLGVLETVNIKGSTAGAARIKVESVVDSRFGLFALQAKTLRCGDMLTGASKIVNLVLSVLK